jgi:hypothetical protein
MPPNEDFRRPNIILERCFEHFSMGKVLDLGDALLVLAGKSAIVGL